MPFGIIGQTGPGMRQVVGFGDRSTGRGTFGANLGRAVVTNGDFTAYVCDSALTVGLGWCVRWAEALLYWMGPTSCKGKGTFWGFLFSIFTMGNAIGSPMVKCFRFLCENFTTFPFGKRIVGKLDSCPFWRYIQFQDLSLIHI